MQSGNIRPKYIWDGYFVHKRPYRKLIRSVFPASFHRLQDCVENKQTGLIWLKVLTYDVSFKMCE